MEVWAAIETRVKNRLVGIFVAEHLNQTHAKQLPHYVKLGYLSHVFIAKFLNSVWTDS